MADDRHFKILEKGTTAWNIWRDDNPEIVPDLTNVDLRGAKLAGIDLYATNLQGAFAPEIVLDGAHLQGVYLQGADLRRASLEGADLQGAFLHRVDFQGANLRGAHLQGSHLENANLDDCILENANLHDANLRNTRLGFLTIDSKTAKQIPEEVRKKYERSWTIPGQNQHSPFTTRSIEFPPEYHDAGVAILSHFGSILRNKYKDIHVGVTITQVGNKVTMIVEHPEGYRKSIVKSLDDYGLVIAGEMSPDDFLHDREQVLQLKNELGLARHRIEMQREIMAYRDADIESLRGLLSQSISSDGTRALQINTTQTLVGHQLNSFNLGSAVALLQGDLKLLQEEVSETEDSEVDAQIRSVEQSLETIPSNASAGEVKASSALARVRRLIMDLGTEDSRLGRLVRGIGKGGKIVVGIAEHYNLIASWCGLPTIPAPFLGSPSARNSNLENGQQREDPNQAA